jgi:CRISPR/Cas system-associated endonuclease/helicase Cas3
LVSTGVSYLVARSTAGTELRKQELQLFRTYAEGLQKHRLDAYPEVYKLLSESLKQFHRGAFTREKLHDLLATFQAWDSAHSLLLSRDAANVFFEAQWLFHDVLAKGTDPLTSEESQKIGERLEAMELALKDDIGVFAVEYEDRRKVRFYDEQPNDNQTQPGRTLV